VKNSAEQALFASIIVTTKAPVAHFRTTLYLLNLAVLFHFMHVIRVGSYVA